MTDENDSQQADYDFGRLTEELTNLREEVNELRVNQRVQTTTTHKLEESLKMMCEEVAYLRDNMPKPKPKYVKLDFASTFPAKDTLVQIKAQLFHNEPNRSGKHGGKREHEWLLKVSFWSCENTDAAIKKLRDGSVKPFCFPLHPPSAHKATDPNSVFYDAEHDHPDTEWVGCFEVKGMGKGIVGTKLFENKVAILTRSRGLQLLDAEWGGFEIHDSTKPAASDDPRSPVEVWTWRRSP